MKKAKSSVKKSTISRSSARPVARKASARKSTQTARVAAPRKPSLSSMIAKQVKSFRGRTSKAS